MPKVTITLADTPTGGVSILTDFQPAIGSPCSPAQAAALEVINRTKKDWGVAADLRGTPKPNSPIPSINHQPRK